MSDWEVLETHTKSVVGTVEMTTDDLLELVREKLNLPSHCVCHFDDWAALTFQYSYEVTDE